MENMYIDVRVLRFEVFDIPNLLKILRKAIRLAPR